MSSIYDPDFQILQIMPAVPGWVAVYEWEGQIYTLPVIGWALVEHQDEDGPSRSVDGLIISGETGGVDLVEGEGFKEFRLEQGGEVPR
jgi:hypothetical protein